MKTCTHCKTPKPLVDFSIRRASPDGLQPACKPCVKLDRETRNYPSLQRERRAEAGRAYFEANRDRFREQARRFREANPEKMNAYREAWKKKNPDKVLARLRVRYATDMHFFLKRRLHRRMSAAIKAQKVSVRYELDLGCTAAEFKAHIERQFTEGMSWANKAEWQLDHIKPIAAFDLSDPEQFRAACHYTNMQPLWAADNRRKGATYVP